MRTVNSKIHSWLQLFRAPNLFTVPGDAVAGVALATAWRGTPPPVGLVLAAAICSLAMYGFGLVLNDLVDIGADRKNRTGRPLAAGEIGWLAAAGAAAGCLVLALLIAWLTGGAMFWVAVALAVTVAAYNVVLKRFAVAGSVAMGLCRALSLLLGAAAAEVAAPTALVAAVGLGVYIAYVTWIADHEEKFHDFDRRVFLPLAGYGGAVVLAVGLSWLNRLPSQALLFALAIGAVGSLRVLYLCRSLSHDTAAPDTIQRAVGAFLGALLPLQAAWLLLGFGGLSTSLAVFLVLLLWPVARLVSYRFYAS